MDFLTVDKRIRSSILGIFALSLAMFHIISGIWGTPNTIAFRYIHLTGMILIVLMRKPIYKSARFCKLTFIDYIMAIAAVAVLVYILSDLNGFANRQGACTRWDIIFGTIYLLILLEVTRRITGIVMIILALFFALQNIVANYMPGFLHTAPISYERLIDHLFLRTTGVIGTALSCMCNYVVFFMIFATILEASGAGQFFIDLALAIAGKSRGGPAKAAVLSSAFFGSLSGSAIANVASTGAITIPLMKKTGYDANFAGAVEAVASTGGQIMPPMMGAAAFIMAENLGISYITLVACAVIPALLYFISVYFMVDMKAGKMGLKAGNVDDLPKLKDVLKRGWVYLLPLVMIVVLLAIGRSAQASAIYSTLLLLVIAVVSPTVKMDGKKMLRSISDGIVSTSTVSVTAATAGIIVGGITISGLSLKLSQVVISVSHGILPLALIFTALVGILLGMGMSTTAVYVTIATVIAPSLVQMGVVNVAAHMFCFYFGIVCTITPPVALASYTAAGLSGGSPSKTGWISFGIGIASYIVPFLFVYKPSLLLQGTVLEVVWNTAVSLVAIYCMAGIVQRYVKTELNLMMTILLACIVVCMLWNHMIVNAIGFVLFFGFLLWQAKRKRGLSDGVVA
ncbi:TRAP transporter permease [Hominifimenecus sp. rT4P-3]|uniref:TRAP transporter permease n=1 Tax=Hominifimenecus sp. rT4P-3 TaxID=3242979 RepID=UPI003DA28B56